MSLDKGDDLIRALRDTALRGYTVRGKPDAAALMLRAADALEASTASAVACIGQVSKSTHETHEPDGRGGMKSKVRWECRKYAGTRLVWVGDRPCTSSATASGGTDG